MMDLVNEVDAEAPPGVLRIILRYYGVVVAEDLDDNDMFADNVPPNVISRIQQMCNKLYNEYGLQGFTYISPETNQLELTKEVQDMCTNILDYDNIIKIRVVYYEIDEEDEYITSTSWIQWDGDLKLMRDDD